MSELNVENKYKFETMVSKMKLLKVGEHFLKTLYFSILRKKHF